MKPATLLTTLIVTGMVLGAIVGQFALHGSEIGGDHWTKVAGDLVLIRPLKLLVIPLVLFSVVAGITRIGDPRKLGRLGGATLVYYFATMLIAVTIGTALVTFFDPGSLPPDVQASVRAGGESAFAADASLSAKVDAKTMGGTWTNILYQLIPTNIVSEMSAGRPLGIIVFAIGLGLALAAGGERTRAAREFFDAGFEGLMTLIQWVVWLTPIGVFLLVAWTVGRIGLENVTGPLGGYMGTVLLGLLIHGAIVLPLILRLFGRVRPFQFMGKMKPALLTAFGTDSSSATLPVTIETAIDEGECSEQAGNFVLPLGATINMDGTALYEAVAVVFLFQLYGIELEFGQLILVVVTATLAAVGAAGIPSAGLVTMVIVIAAVNGSLGDAPTLPVAAIGVILGVDRILDMCRTTVNVWGDAVGARIMTRITPDTPATPEA
ncbi:MAG: dicarboxylate/amino acid:cation symporter [Phycisphaerales bacterium]|jgi:Na+/H+-dicarboxylate symporter|nr:dicarboxylate/amino acid:cation symporter [Phycisphaerales bacterium]